MRPLELLILLGAVGVAYAIAEPALDRYQRTLDRIDGAPALTEKERAWVHDSCVGSVLRNDRGLLYSVAVERCAELARRGLHPPETD